MRLIKFNVLIFFLNFTAFANASLVISLSQMSVNQNSCSNTTIDLKTCGQAGYSDYEVVNSQLGHLK